MTFKLIEHDAQLGITTTVHRTETKAVIEKSYDAEPMLKLAADMRQGTQGETWGDVRHVGFIPMAELATMMRQDGGFDRSRVMAWLKKNPALVTFDKALK